MELEEKIYLGLKEMGFSVVIVSHRKSLTKMVDKEYRVADGTVALGRQD